MCIWVTYDGVTECRDFPAVAINPPELFFCPPCEEQRWFGSGCSLHDLRHDASPKEPKRNLLKSYTSPVLPGNQQWLCPVI